MPFTSGTAASATARSGPTRAGWLLVVATGLAIVIARIFGILELYVIAAGAGAAVGLAALTVRRGVDGISAHRWIHPPILTVGDTGRVDLTISNEGRHRSPRVAVTEPVGPDDSARLTVAPLASGQHVEAAYRLPASRRGVLEIGPLHLEHRDQLGLARCARLVAPLVDVVVAPRAHDLPMPELGRGVLGRHLLAQAQRTGAGEFHSLRDYVAGDEPRLINWRASARSEALKVRQHTTEGVRRCIVLLDLDAEVYGEGDAFERAVTAAASLVASGDRSGLTTRFVTAGGIDLRGPEVTTTTLRVLARIAPGVAMGEIERDPGEGLGLVMVVTASTGTVLWRTSESLLDPTLTRVGIFTGTDDSAPGPVGRLGVNAETEQRFVEGWSALAGKGGLDVRSRLAQRPVGEPV